MMLVMWQRLLYRHVESFWKVTAPCDVDVFFYESYKNHKYPQILWLCTAPDEDLILLAMNQSLGRNFFTSVIHSDTLHSQEVRRLHSAWLICCHGDRNDTEPSARQEKAGGWLDEWDKFKGDWGSVRSSQVGEWGEECQLNETLGLCRQFPWD